MAGDHTSLENSFRSIKVWEANGERAPNKPLLLLLALGESVNKGRRLLSFSEVDVKLRSLLVEFGPDRTVYHTEYPFWYLQSDGVWEVEPREAAQLAIQTRGYPTKGDLLRVKAQGGFPEPLFRLIVSDHQLVVRLARALLEEAFPGSIHDDILAAVGLDAVQQDRSRRRDSTFRGRVLTAYEYRCAVCGFDARFKGIQAALEAAHIMWHQAGGPDTEANGIALCTLHHKLFDLGGVTILRDGRIAVSEQLHGTGTFIDFVLSYSGACAREPVNPAYAPDPQYLQWHHQQVFKGPARPLN